MNREEVVERGYQNFECGLAEAELDITARERQREMNR